MAAPVTLDQVSLARELALEGDWDAAAQLFLDALTEPDPKTGQLADVEVGTGKAMFATILPTLLDHYEAYEEVARFLWGKDVFTTEPSEVKRVWDACGTRSKMLIQGAGSMGKSYTMGVWALLDWYRDPVNTDAKMVSLTKGHGKDNIWGHVKHLHSLAQSFVGCLPGVLTADGLTIPGVEKAGIQLVAIRAGENGAGRLQGLHPSPRTGDPHWRFGKLTRKRIYLDEAEEIPQGIWVDLDNFFTSIKDDHLDDHLLCIGAANPRNKTSMFGIRCEPKDGWDSIHVDSSFRWESVYGWTILRLDAAQSENVMERKVIFPSLQTWKGYQTYAKRGETDPEYLTMARGWFPTSSTASSVVVPDYVWTRALRCVFEWSGPTVPLAGVDLAFGGGDKAVMCHGLWGPVTGYKDPSGEFHKALPGAFGLQVSGFVTLTKTHSVDLADEIMRLCGAFGIEGDWLALDATGSGKGVCDILQRKFKGKPPRSTIWSEAATDRRIMREDTKPADETCDGLVTELVYAVSKFIEFDVLKLAPIALTQAPKLAVDVCERRMTMVTRGRVRVEPKTEFKLRVMASPDYGDAMALLVEAARHKGIYAPAMLPAPPRRKLTSWDQGVKVKTGTVDKLDNI